jgi:hypothetical protein
VTGEKIICKDKQDTQAKTTAYANGPTLRLSTCHAQNLQNGAAKN